MKQHVLLDKAFRYDKPEEVKKPLNCTYNAERGFWIKNDNGEIMMLSDDSRPLQSKKCDRETGEDQKGE
jgi:hypothetical protein